MVRSVPVNYEAGQNYSSTPIYLSCLAFLILLCLTPHLINERYTPNARLCLLANNGCAGPLPAWLGFGLSGGSYGRRKIYGVDLVIPIVVTVDAFARYKF
jgi:hypothetical protein